MELQIVVNEKLQLILDNGTVDKLVQDQLTKTVGSIVNDLFNDYSDFGKKLKKVLSEKMQVSLENLKIDNYTTMVCHAIEEAVVGTILENSKTKILSHVKEICGSIEKTNWKLSEIVAMYREKLSEHPELVVEVGDVQYNSRWIQIGEKVEKSYSSYSTPTQQYEIRILIDGKTNKVNNVWMEGKLIDSRNSKMYNHSIEVFLMQLWAQDCILEIDEDDAKYEATKGQYED